MIDIGLIEACANGVDPHTIHAVIQAESGGNPRAINVNPAQPLPAIKTDERAAQIVDGLLREKKSVDVGLMQINSQHFARFNVTPAQLLDPCTNIFVGSSILAEAYRDAVKRHGPGQAALRAALSTYNSGHPLRGIASGYVGRVLTQAGASDGPSQAVLRSPIEVPFAYIYDENSDEKTP